MTILFQILNKRWFLYLVLLLNAFGTIYGYIWYGEQLSDTPAIFLIFVPDSPTASLFFALVVIAFLLKKNWPLIEALAIVTLIKYGIWAVVMNILVLVVTGEISGVAIMLITSHAAMALQGMLYSPFYRIKAWHLIVVAIWTIHNDIIDYLFKMMPRYHMLDQYTISIGYFTFWLSIVSIFVAYLLCIKKERFNSKLTQ
ncbi:hypothetical protein BK120_23540 [Paenibacillus sp. FSL A5-0031]|uniref:DUF1405 domain-containing protein n=1 Tax=Paenibacillus sp. FSL A5-0031 TaxID=1920420 RepID=UPI00096DC453|nr:DUF1405 domain-containing protein [Paenibacillus sp. FSL A5-0031]OME78711.1 hypothetical protein BK120_23540 [Paenibacillus sp. FSL A5-0031]